ncbi:hypothetical protein T4E_8112 [Trichinella pseudospiralis]|uniref:Uncharacterized protein n=1 Tax=Trichinella pseudospiralis TaxID=6337 RepID=A0A0V0Y9Q5_TRIPS|nr:hypothetical protein T4E_8112 [Trichinella pseudospiralis]
MENTDVSIVNEQRRCVTCLSCLRHHFLHSELQNTFLKSGAERVGLSAWSKNQSALSVGCR